MQRRLALAGLVAASFASQPAAAATASAADPASCTKTMYDYGYARDTLDVARYPRTR